MTSTDFERGGRPPEKGEFGDGNLEQFFIDPSVVEGKHIATIVGIIALNTLESQRLKDERAGVVTSQKLNDAIRLTELMTQEQYPDLDGFEDARDKQVLTKEGEYLCYDTLNSLYDRAALLEKQGLTTEQAAHALVEEYNRTVAVEQTAHERLSPAEVMVDVTEAAKDRTVVYTYTANGIGTRRGDEVATSRGGFEMFGSGSNNRTDSMLLEAGLPDDPPSEFVQFLPLSSITEAMPDVIRNPKTGKEEAVTVVRYKFQYNEADARLASARGGYKLPPYFEQSGRGQNFLEVVAMLPKSTADNLHRLLSNNPSAARIIAADLVKTEGGLGERDWSEPKQGQFGGVKQRPPYEGLPADWRIGVY